MAKKFVAVQFPLYETPGDGGGGGGTGDGGQGGNNDASNKPDASGSSGQPSGGAPGTGQPNPGDDSRYKGILSDLQKERKARQEFERQAAAHRAELEAERRRVQALAGLTPQSESEQQDEAVRQRFKQLYPHLADLSAEDLQALRELKQQAGSLQEATTHHYQLHGRKMLDAVGQAVTKAVGGTLTPRQLSRLEAAYVREAEINPQFLARHDAGDPKLIEEFAKEWIDDWFEPARRKVTQDEVTRQRRVPSGRDRSVTGVGGKKIDFSNPKAVEDAMVESYRQNGGAFGE